MRDFSLGCRFDAVVCLFSGIGYLTEEVELRQAISTMAAHLHAGGVLMIEGWVEPDYWIGATVRAEAADGDDVAVARVARSARDGMLCQISMRYVIATHDSIVNVDEQHTMRLSEPNEFVAAFDAAGLSFERLPHMLHPGRSLYVGTAPS